MLASVVSDILLAWKSLPGGKNYPPEVIAKWLMEDMYPSIENARKALAALEAEKPAEDSALSAVERWADEYYGHSVLVGDIHRSLAIAFTAFAHSYHLAECAKCKALPTDDVSEMGA